MIRSVVATLARSARATPAMRRVVASMAWRAALSTTPSSFRAASSGDPMFCNQCEQTKDSVGCTTIGVCGKTPEVAALQDLLVYAARGLSEVARAAPAGTVSAATEKLLKEALFSTLTNVNFDAEAVAEYTRKLVAARDAARAKVPAGVTLSDVATFTLDGPDAGSQILQGMRVGVQARREGKIDPNVRSLNELLTYGVKGVAAYAHHAEVLGQTSRFVEDTLQEALAAIGKVQDVNALVGLALKVGEANVHAMKTLNEAHKAQFGTPTPSTVKARPVKGKAILVSGHDMGDLHDLLKATEGTGINVYTHGEMLPAHGYPELRKYKHLVGNYGGAWQNQKVEFAEFPGPILMTSNCIIEPRPSYRDRTFTMNAVGYEGVRHLQRSDLAPIIESAKQAEGFDSDSVEEIEDKFTMTGFGHDVVLSIADQVIKAVDEGKLRHFFVVGGCDGSEGERSYYTDFVRSTPDDTVVLTLGCGKYRFNYDFERMGNVPGTAIPRMLDVGQCNDAYSAVVIALKLAEHYKTDVNSLPLSLVVSWFEQKAVAVLLSLLHLGIKDVHIGPRPPAFVSPDVFKVLVDKFNLTMIGEPVKDLTKMLGTDKGIKAVEASL